MNTPNPMPLEPIADGAPYRVPAPAELPEPPALLAPIPRKPRPILGPALSLFAVVLWTFVVVGQFTTSWPLGTPVSQGTAAVLFLSMTFVVWVASVRRSHALLKPRSIVHLMGRAIAIAVLTFVAFLVCLVAATVGGAASRQSHDFLVAFVLVVLSLFAAIAGPRIASPTPRERTHRQRFFLVVLWIGGVLLTLITAADLAIHG